MLTHTDIVERLRRWDPAFASQQPWGLLNDAADEIVRLRNLVDQLDAIIDHDRGAGDPPIVRWWHPTRAEAPRP